MKKLFFSKEEYRESDNIFFQNEKQKDIQLYVINNLGHQLSTNHLEFLQRITKLFYMKECTLNLVGIIHHTVLNGLKQIIIASNDCIIIRSDYTNLDYIPCVIEIKNNKIVFQKLLQLLWNFSGNEPLCWFYSRKRININNVVNKNERYLSFIFNIEEVQPIFIKGLDGDELLIYHTNKIDLEKIR